MRRLILPLIILSLAFCRISMAETPYSFRSLSSVDGSMTSVFSIVQDRDGFIWLGTDDGLARYDGHSYRFFRSGEGSPLADDIINALLYDEESGLLYVGTDKGACTYDPETDLLSRMQECGDRHVKSFLRDGDFLWVGTTTGLLKVDLVSGGKEVTVYSSEGTGPEKLPSGHIACCRKIGDNLYFGSYNYLYRVRPSGEFDMFPLKGAGSSPGDFLLLDIARDTGGRLLLGTETGLVGYDPGSRRLDLLIRNTPVKFFSRDRNGLMWAGTDNGLYIEDGKGNFSRFRHEVGNSSSLPNNVVWCIFRDKADNVWLGTDHGVALTKASGPYSFHSLKEVTGTDGGLDVGVICTDASGGLWLGGRDGLIRCDMKSGKGKWLKSDSGSPRLSHNKVRAVHDDGDYLWIVSDGGLDRYSHAGGNIEHFHLVEPSGKFSSVWMYDIGEDRYGRLWIGTYDGGIFVTDKRKFLSGGTTVVCDMHFSTASARPVRGNIVRNLEIAGTSCVAVTEGGVELIGTDSWEVSHLPLPGGKAVMALAVDGDTIYAGTDGGVFRLDGSAWEKIDRTGLAVSNIIPYDGTLWAVSNGGIYVLDRENGLWSRLSTGDVPIISGTVDGERLFLGAVDAYIEADGSLASYEETMAKPVLTSLLIGNSTVETGREYGGQVILENNLPHTESIRLPSEYNSFSLEFSSFSFSEKNDRYAYRLKGFDDSWQYTADGVNRAVFINIPAGNYVFEVASMGRWNDGPDEMTSLGIRIPPMWYSTTLAYVVYVLLGIGLCVCAFYYIRMRHQLSIEHLEREKALRMADQKTEFLSNVSHEFKSPLSIILGFVGKMVSSEADAIRSRDLQAVQKNAEKIHLLLNQMMEFNENSGNTLFIPAAASLQDLSKEVFDRYTRSFDEKHINYRFVSDDIPYIFMLDRLKMESVFSNLLSNALKFTPEGGSILMSVSIGEETPDIIYADVKVEDTGCGIAADELPMIFNRYYKAPSNQQINVGGSGIGLDLAKQIVEMHKGRIMVSSEPGKGSCFTVRLSTMKADSFILKSADMEDFTLHNLSKVWQHERKPILLLVEDNQDIRDFITASLGKDYSILLASEGGEALKLLETEKIDLVISDISMPGMDGLTMSRTIRNSLKTAFLPIIILTGKNDMHTKIQSFEYADAFIPKPFNLNYLNNRIIQLLIKHEQYLDKMKQKNLISSQEVEPVRSQDERLLSDVMEIVNRHMDDPGFSASSLCEESRFSSKQIYRKIKQLTGLSIVEFIRDVRLEKAALYLSQGKLTVTEVMYKVGFTTPSYFAKCFKEKFGVSPSEYDPKVGD